MDPGGGAADVSQELVLIFFSFLGGPRGTVQWIVARESVCLKYSSVVFLLYDALNPISKPGGPVSLLSV